jgi:hypothetical protein
MADINCFARLVRPVDAGHSDPLIMIVENFDEEAINHVAIAALDIDVHSAQAICDVLLHGSNPQFAVRLSTASDPVGTELDGVLSSSFMKPSVANAVCPSAKPSS